MFRSKTETSGKRDENSGSSRLLLWPLAFVIRLMANFYPSVAPSDRRRHGADRIGGRVGEQESALLVLPFAKGSCSTVEGSQGLHLTAVWNGYKPDSLDSNHQSRPLNVFPFSLNICYQTGRNSQWLIMAVIASIWLILPRAGRRRARDDGRSTARETILCGWRSKKRLSLESASGTSGRRGEGR